MTLFAQRHKTLADKKLWSVRRLKNLIFYKLYFMTEKRKKETMENSSFYLISPKKRKYHHQRRKLIKVHLFNTKKLNDFF